ncbi:MAG: CocE/NonD family hydrolase [Cyanobacteria bacterium J06649_11]
MYLHGGFALGYQDIYDCKKFTDNGFIVMAPSFRAENGNEGFYEFLFGEVKDAESAVKWLSKQEYVDSDSIYVFGHSTGGALSLSLSLRDDLHVQFGGRYPPQLLGQ